MLRGIVNSATGKEATIEEISSAVAVQSDDVDRYGSYNETND